MQLTWLRTNQSVGSVLVSVATGVASAVLPAVKILDQIYSTRITLEGLATRYGMKQEGWPEAVIESLKARHNAIYSQIEDQICGLGGAYYPLGKPSLVNSNMDQD